MNKNKLEVILSKLKEIHNDILNTDSEISDSTNSGELDRTNPKHYEDQRPYEKLLDGIANSLLEIIEEIELFVIKINKEK